MQVINKPKLKEDLIVAGFFLCLLLPLRFVFYNYLSHYWIGSFGVLTAITLGLFYLSKKGKLGFFGRIFLKSLTRRTRGKSFKVAITMSIIAIYLSALIVASNVYADNQAYVNTKKQLKTEGVTDMKTLETYNNSHPQIQTPLYYIEGTILLITPNPFSFVVFKVANDLLNGWLLTLFTVTLIEEIELLGILIYLRVGATKLV